MIIFEKKISKSLRIAYVTTNDEALISGRFIGEPLSEGESLEREALMDLFSTWLYADENNWVIILPDGSQEEILDGDLAEFVNEAYIDRVEKAAKKNSTICSALNKIREQPFYQGRSKK